MDNSFKLDPFEHERIYTKIIEPATFWGTSAVEKPRIVLVGAQTGAGKTFVVERSGAEFPDGNVVTINTDDLRSFHPKFDEIVSLDDKRSAELTQEDASAWNRKLLNRCIKMRRNIVLEGVFKDAAGLIEIFESLKNNGYEVTVRIVAVHERYSVWGINLRYEKEKLVRGHGRYVPIEFHDECYRNLPDTVALVEERKMADCIEIFNRNGEILYSNTLAEGDWKKQPRAKAEIELERARKLTERETIEFTEGWARIFEYMNQRRASSQEIAVLTALAERFNQEL